MNKRDLFEEFVELAGLASTDPDDEGAFEPGLVGIYNPNNPKELWDIRYLSDEEKDTLRQIAGEITHYRIFKR